MKMMKCGHAANAVDAQNNPVCAICVGITPGASEVDQSPPSLEGRTARCCYCQSTRPSDYSLPFFEHQYRSYGDSFYCGCKGWD